MNMPFISVVVPLFNKEADIAETIKSVLNQSYGRFELLVVDDGSTDQSLAVTKLFADPRLKIIEKKNGGECSARNEGIKNARGDIICFLDGDDLYTEDFLKTIVSLFEEYPTAGIVSTGYVIRSEACEERVDISPDFRGIGNYFIFSKGRYSITSSSCGVLRKCFEVTGVFNENLVHGGDLDMWARICMNYPWAYSNEKLAVYRHDGSNRVGRRMPPLEKDFVYHIPRLKKQTDKVEVHAYLKEIVVLGIKKYSLHGGPRNVVGIYEKNGIVFKTLPYFVFSFLPKRLKALVYSRMKKNEACH